MYADRYANRRSLDPGGLAFALGAGSLLVFGLTLTTPHFLSSIDKPFVIRSYPLDPPPVEHIKPKPQPETKHVKTMPIDPIDTTKPLVIADAGGFTAKPIDIAPSGTEIAGTGGDIGTIIPPHNPVLRDPSLDSRYIDNFQPAYPSDERLAGHEGRVVVRVLIGTDGRVKDVQQVSAASTAFFEATRKQALAKWRFRPGTSDGVAVEAWHTMAVRFVLDEG